jgi:hypothetical protein
MGISPGPGAALALKLSSPSSIDLAVVAFETDRRPVRALSRSRLEGKEMSEGCARSRRRRSDSGIRRTHLEDRV